MHHLEINSDDIELLVKLLEKIVVLIGGPSMCKGVVKSINVIKNKNYSGMRSVKKIYMKTLE